MEQSVVGHPVHLGLPRIVVIKQPRSRRLPAQLQEVVDLFYGLEGFLKRASESRSRRTKFGKLQFHLCEGFQTVYLPEVDADGAFELLEADVDEILDGFGIFESQRVAL